MRSLKIGFTSPQGGSGVSTLTVAVASRLHYYHKIPVAVMDCDISKLSCVRLREKETVPDEADVYGIYPLSPAAVGFGDELEKYPETILYDLAGIMDTAVLSKMDYVYIPIVESHMLGNAMRSVMKTAEDFYKAGAGTKFRVFMNKCKPSGQESLWDIVYETGFEPTDLIQITETRILSRLAILNNIYCDRPAVPTTCTLDDIVMKNVGFYHLEKLVLRDINRPRIWKQL